MIPPRDNPCRVDRVTALPFLGEDLNALADRFLAFGQAAIVGPHGVGKSTLLRSIGQTLADRGHAVRLIALPGSASPAERSAVIRLPTDGEAILLLDGYEQLRLWHRYRVRRRFPRLLVTAHLPGRHLPSLATLRPTSQTLDRILVELLDSVPPEVTHFARARFAHHQGDVRQTLFDLYDHVGE